MLGFLAATRGLGGYRIEVDHGVYAALRDYATSALGAAEATEVRAYTTGTGERLQGERLTWRWPSGTLAWLDERCERVSRSCLTVATRDLVAQMQPRPQREATDPRAPKSGKGERPPSKRPRP
jgi:hypothetical protein